MDHIFRHFSLTCVFDFQKYHYVLIEQNREEKLKIKQIFEKAEQRHGFYIDDSSIYLLFETTADKRDALLTDFEGIARNCHRVHKSDIPESSVWPRAGRSAA